MMIKHCLLTALVVVCAFGSLMARTVEQSLPIVPIVPGQAPDAGLIQNNNEKYYIFGNNALKSYYLSHLYDAALQPVAPIQPLAPYTQRIGADVMAVGNGVGFYPAFMQRIANGYYFQIRAGVLALSHGIANLRYNNAFGSNPYGATFIMPIFGGLQKYFYVGKFSNRLAPYLTTGIGPVFGLNYSGGGSNFGQSSYPTTFRVGPAGFLGAGATVMLSPRYWITFEGRYDLIYFTSRLGPWNNYSGPAFSIGFSRGFYF